MKLRYRTFALLLLLPVIGHADQPIPAQVIATLTLPHETVLPGVPFDIAVEIKNLTSHPITVGISARLRVTLPDGTTMHPEYYARLEPPDPAIHAETYLELAPGESHQSVVKLGHSGFDRYEAYSGPGSYEIALELAGAQTPENYVGPIVTSTARLHRGVAPGEDEALWKKMQATRDCMMDYSTTLPPKEICIGGWSDDAFIRLKGGVAIAKEIRELHPASQYYPYAVLLQFRNESDLSQILDAAERFPDSPAHPYLLLLAANNAESKGIRAQQNGDADVDKYYALAGKLYSQALEHASNPAVRETAHRGIISVQTRGRTPSQ